MSFWIAGTALLATGANIAYSESKDKELKSTNKDLSKTYDKQIEELTKSISGIEDYSAGLIELEADTSKIRKDDMFTDFLIKSEDMTQNYDIAEGKTGLATSGTLERDERIKRERLRGQVALGEADESLTTEKNLLRILTGKEDSLSGVKNQIFDLESAKAGLRT